MAKKYRFVLLEHHLVDEFVVALINSQHIFGILEAHGWVELKHSTSETTEAELKDAEFTEVRDVFLSAIPTIILLEHHLEWMLKILSPTIIENKHLAEEVAERLNVLRTSSFHGMFIASTIRNYLLEKFSTREARRLSEPSTIESKKCKRSRMLINLDVSKASRN